jgi:hypothetical protein
MNPPDRTGARPGSWRDRPVHRRIQVQQLLTVVIGLVVLGLAVVDLVAGVLGPIPAVAGFVGGAVVGLVAARVNRVAWDAETARVVASVDRIGLVILVVVLAARLSRDWLLGHWAAGAVLTALGLWITAGSLVGRVVGTGARVAAALRRVGLRPPGRPASSE